MTYQTFSQPKNDRKPVNVKTGVDNAVSGLISRRSILTLTLGSIITYFTASMFFILASAGFGSGTFVGPVGGLIASILAVVTVIVGFIVFLITGISLIATGNKRKRTQPKLVGGFLVSSAFSPLLALIAWGPFATILPYGDMLLGTLVLLIMIFGSLLYFKRSR